MAGRPAKNLMGKDISDVLKGTRLAAHLLDIRDRFGESDSHLKSLATAALRGATRIEGRDVFTAIRARLHDHSQDKALAAGDPHSDPEEYSKRAKDLATGFNWHRMGDALQLDEFVADHIKSLTKDPTKGTHLRSAHDLISKGDHPVGQFLVSSLQNAAKGWTGSNSALGARAKQLTPDFLKASVERLARRESYKEGLHEKAARKLVETRPSRGFKKGGAVDEVDTLNWLPGSGPAYSMSTTGRERVKSGLDAEQYEREEKALKYALGLTSAMNAVGLGRRPAAQPIGPDGVAFSGEPGSQHSPTHPSNLERQAVALQLHGLGVIDLHDHNQKTLNHSKVDQYTGFIRNHVRSNVNDLLSQHYLKGLGTEAGKTHTARSIQETLSPLVNWAASRHGLGDRPDLFQPQEHLPIAEEIPDENHPTETAGETEVKKSPFKVPVDVLSQAALNRKPVDDTPLPVVTGRVPKAPATKLKAALKLKGRDENGFGLLQGLKDNGVGEEGWVDHLVKSGLNKRSAEAVKKKFLTRKNIPDLRPLRLNKQSESAVRYNKALKRLRGD